MQKQNSSEKVVLRSEDIRNVMEFFNHFRIPIPKDLQDQIDAYVKNPNSYTLQQQNQFKAQLSRAVLESDHELLQDDIFNNIKGFCDKEWYNAQFEKDLEEALSEDND